MNIQYSNVKFIPALLAWLCIGIAYYFSVEAPFENKYLRGIILSIGMYGVYNMTNSCSNLYNANSFNSIIIRVRGSNNAT